MSVALVDPQRGLCPPEPPKAKATNLKSPQALSSDETSSTPLNTASHLIPTPAWREVWVVIRIHQRSK